MKVFRIKDSQNQLSASRKICKLYNELYLTRVSRQSIAVRCPAGTVPAVIHAFGQHFLPTFEVAFVSCDSNCPDCPHEWV